MKNLYRRYRPLSLSEVVGQEQVTKTLEKSLAQGKIGHAYLFVGPRGCGKTSVARILAHAVNGFDYELEDDYVDIIEIDGASNRGIDNIRELREKVAIAPTVGKYKVYIIDEVHMLTKEAFNALLKTLEEPPAHAIFIMATTDAYKVPVTITSRAQTYTFKLASHKVMFDFLKNVCANEKITIADEALDVIVRRGGGSFRDSLSLLDQISTLSDNKITKEMVVAAMGLPQDEQIHTLLQTYESGNLSTISNCLKDLLSSGVKAETLAEELIELIVANPQPGLMSLLAKLPEVKAPYAEAKLLVALTDTTHLPSRIPSHPLKQSPRVRLTSSSNQPIEYKNAPASAGLDTNENEHPVSATLSNISTDIPSSNFDWQTFVDKVQELNDAVYSQLIKTEHEIIGSDLHIYPAKKIVKNILSRDNNKRILVEAARGIKIVIHEIDEKPSSIKKDETLDKISAIMGGEVQNDGGGNPFK